MQEDAEYGMELSAFFIVAVIDMDQAKPWTHITALGGACVKQTNPSGPSNYTPLLQHVYQHVMPLSQVPPCAQGLSLASPVRGGGD